MSMRVRLTWYYSILFALILLFVTLLSYTIHTRGEYDDLDQTLLVSVEHAAAAVTSPKGESHLIQGKNNLGLALRLFNAHGALEEETSGSDTIPVADPHAVLHAPAGPAYDAVSHLMPPLLSSPASPDPGGAFGLLQASGQRWRVYVLTLHQANTPSGYLEAVLSLSRVDREIQELRFFLPMIGLTGLALALLGSWAIAGGALRPIATMIQTAQGIAQSRDLSRRVEAPPHRDELGKLAATFNAMLASLETAHQAQQRFVADASHELRAPLTAIQGNLDLLNRHPRMPETERAEALAEMTREAERLTRLVADLLALARADAGMPITHHLIDLDVIVLDVFRSARTLAHGQILILDPFEPAQVCGDEDRLKQVLLILLDNALKYTPEGGRVTLGLARQETNVQITIQDTGRGIAAQDVPHVFERFYRSDPGRGRDPGGTGLGLPIAQWIVEQHHGTIRLTSQPNQGTRVVVCLPFSLAELREQARQNKPMSSPG